MVMQQTIAREVETVGIGVHSGANIQLKLRPAEANTGIVFYRTDLDQPVAIPALSEYVVDTRLGTSLAKEGQRIATVEHLMAALAGLGIDNLHVDVGGPEMLIGDGSSLTFLELIQSVGLTQQSELKKFIRINETIEVTDGDKSARLQAYDGFKVALEIDFDHPALQATAQNLSIDLSNMSFANEIGRARTFGFLSDYEMLRANNLALGASPKNTIVLDDSAVLNEEGLRYDDEFVRHKILDAVGDLYLLGASIIGEFVGHKSGHTMNHMIRNALLDNPSSWEYMTFDQQQDAPISFDLA